MKSQRQVSIKDSRAAGYQILGQWHLAYKTSSSCAELSKLAFVTRTVFSRTSSGIVFASRRLAASNLTTRFNSSTRMDGTPTIALNDGTRVPLFAYGTATALYHKDAKDWVKMAYQDANMRHIDTAACYQNENTVGAALKELAIERGGVFITTKCESSPPRVRGGSEAEDLKSRWRERETSPVIGGVAEAGKPPCESFVRRCSFTDALLGFVDGRRIRRSVFDP
jgi:hypothetical protein